MAKKVKEPVITVTSCMTIIVFGMIIFFALFGFFALRGSSNHSKSTEGETLMTVIPAPTVTPTIYATEEPVSLDIHYVSPEGFSIGALVQIYNTENVGLIFRPEPGISGFVSFVAPEGEKFRIVDGPDVKNDFTWWKLQSNTDEERVGWAVSEYLKLLMPAEADREGSNGR